MKLIKNIYIALASVMILLSACVDPDNITPVNSTGGLLEVTTPSINLVIGENKDYNVEFRVYQEPDVRTTKIDAYVTFHTYKRNADGFVSWEVNPEDANDSSKVELVSNEKLLKSLDITQALTYFESFSVNLSDLASGLSVEGNDYYTELPTLDTEYLIGDYWEIRFVSTLSTGDVHENYKRAKVSISTRFAGTYITTSSSYLHPTEGYLGDWNGLTKYVESVDTKTYRLTYIGSWYDATDNILYFQVNDDYTITVLTEYAGNTTLIWGADPVATCQDGELPDIDCANTNFVELKDDGADVIHIAYGYIRDTGTRQFEETMVKQVN